MLATAGDLGISTLKPYNKLTILDGYLYVYNCDAVAAIDGFLMNECSLNLTQTQLELTHDLIAFEDNLYERDGIAALDRLFVGMIETGQDCTTYQGGLSGCA